jgi:hypothetical protein
VDEWVVVVGGGGGGAERDVIFPAVLRPSVTVAFSQSVSHTHPYRESSRPHGTMNTSGNNSVNKSVNNSVNRSVKVN